ncbi:hypothetical protein SLEP1_g42909 [Rubroshorea leprosula]|uniref:Uncharacterized protein n=1 Tax=Rubroshorea leprosula TaxID=152421 RepID=A0AAV5LBC9_9ROSI|nr:hypothetical protein SLEP1_g42909 [Rubroshorea leprosula]
MADEANLEKGALENPVENMENTLKELMVSFQSLQATSRAPLTTNPLIEGNVPVASLPIATSTLTLGKEPMSSCLPHHTIVGASRIKPFVLDVGVATVQTNGNDEVETQVVKSITEDEDKAIKAKVEDGIKSDVILDYQVIKDILEQHQNALGELTPIPANKPPNPLPFQYDPQAKCDYHSRTIGHDIERCLTLKHKIQDLKDSKCLRFHSDKIDLRTATDEGFHK